MQAYRWVLGVSKQASAQEIWEAYLRLAKQFHPDMGLDSARQFQEVNEAYEKLMSLKPRSEVKSSAKRSDYYESLLRDAERASKSEWYSQKKEQEKWLSQKERIRRDIEVKARIKEQERVERERMKFRQE